MRLKVWFRKTGACLFAAALVGMTAFAVAYEPETVGVEYRHEVQSGETLWKVCVLPREVSRGEVRGEGR